MAFRRHRRFVRRRPRIARRNRRFIARRRRTMAIKRLPLSNKVGVHWFKRSLTWGQDLVGATYPALTFGNVANGANMTSSISVQAFSISASSTAGNLSSVSFVYAPLVANLEALGDFTGLFDAYQIRKVVFKITPYSNVVNTESGQLGLILHTAIDHDDATLPMAAENGIQQLQRYVSYRKSNITNSMSRPIVISLKPRATAIVQREDGANINALEVPRNQWLDLAQPGIPHYSLKGIFEVVCPDSNSHILYMRCETTYYLKFKGVR